MRNSKRIISLMLSLALLVSSVFVGGITASAAVDLWSTTMTFDDVWDDYNVVFRKSETGEKFSSVEVVIDGSVPTTNEGDQPHYIAHWGCNIADTTAIGGSGNALYWDGGYSYTNKWVPRASVYTNNIVDGNLERFKPAANTTYEVRLKYYVAKAPSAEMVMTVRYTPYDELHVLNAYDESQIWCDNVFTVDSATDGWVEAVAKFTTPATVGGYMCLAFSSTGSTSPVDVEVYTDDITVSECAPITAHNFNDDGDKTLYASQYDTIATLEVPTRDGYIFSGVYSDAALSNKINTDELAVNYTDLYYGWNELEDGEYYCGFENYTVETNGVSYDSSVSSIVSGDTYAGGYAMQNILTADELVAFELRDSEAFNVTKGTEYKISFAYKATANAALYAGLAAASSVPSSAYALSNGELTATSDWKTASIDVTLDKGTTDGFVLAFLLSSESNATVVIDDVFITYPVDDATVNMPSIDDPGTDWYPTLGVFEGITFPEASAIWDGKTLTKPEANADGVYEITSGEELAYAIYYGGTVEEETGCSFILTKDIYLNDVTKINWSNGVVDENYTVKKWYGNWVSSTHSIYFEGTIDGNYHTVYGLYVDDNSKSYTNSQEGAGLIPKAKGAATTTVKNLAIDKAYVDYYGTASAFVALADEDAVVNMSNCYAGKDVTLVGANAAALRGRGWKSNGGVFDNCYSLATTSTQIENGCYGLLGYLYEEDGTKITFNTCYNANGPLTWGTGSGYHCVASNCYETVASMESDGGYPLTDGVTIITDVANMQGADALANGSKMLGLNAFGNHYTATDTYPTLSVFKGITVNEIWNGTTLEPKETDDDGNVLIHNGKELAWVISDGGVAGTTYKLTNNIYLNRLDLINWSTGEAVSGYTPTSWLAGKTFNGNLDGDGYTVYGLYYNAGLETSEMSAGFGSSIGLVPNIPNGATTSISKIGVDYMFINAPSTASPLVGSVGSNVSTDPVTTLNIDQCYIGENVDVTAAAAGHVRGWARWCELSVTNTYSLATVRSNQESTAFDPELTFFIANGWDSNFITLKNCYVLHGGYYKGAWPSLTTYLRSYAGGYTPGEATTKVWYVCNSDVSLDETTMSGLDALTASNKMPKLNTDDDGNATTMYTATEGYPILTVFNGKMDTTIKAPEVDDDTTTGETSGTVSGDVTYTIWDGSTATAPATGTGTETDPYIINEAAELYYVVKNGGAADTYYKLNKDIYLNDLTKVNWLTGTIAEDYKVHTWVNGVNALFQGNIDGNGHTVHGLYVQDGKLTYSSYHSYGAGLISHVKEGSATIKNLAIDDSFMRYEAGCGLFVGAVGTGASVSLTNCYAGANVGLDGGSVSGLIGVVLDSTVDILNCYSLASVKVGSSTGLVANDYSNNSDIKLNNCFNANGCILSDTSSGVVVNNCFQTEAGAHTSGVTTLAQENMKGDDALTNADKMAGLTMANAYITSTATFAEQDIYTYLPAGTKLDSSISATFYDNMLAPLAESAVLLRGRMLRGAYVKFAELPDETLITIPAAKATETVLRGGALELLENGEYYGIESELISEHLAKQSDTSVNYLFITDIHNTHTTESAAKSARGNANMKQMELLAKIANENDEIDFIVIGGDLAQGYSADKSDHLTYLKDLLTPVLESKKPVFALKGNHDDNSYTDVGSMTSVISNMDWNNTVIKYLEEGIGYTVVHDSTDENSNYYYYDLEDKKTRIICLNASDYPQTYDENGNITWLADKDATAAETSRSRYMTGYNFWGYSDAQMTWLANEALTAEDGWNYIFFSHMGIDSGLNGTEASRTYNNGTVLRNIIDSFQNKNNYLNEALGIDRYWCETQGKILAYQFGHEHTWSELYNDDIDLWEILTSCSGGSTSSLKQIFWGENQLYFDVMSVNENYIYKHNVGGGSDLKMISSYYQLEGDIDVDGDTDITDLVRLAKLENGDFLPTTRSKNQNQTKLRRILLGEIIALQDYYQDMASESADQINETLAASGDNTSSFLYWTDTHWRTNHESSYELLKYFTQTTPLDKVIFGGDIANDDDPTADNINEWRKLSLMLPNHHSVTGNHEYTTPHLYEYVLPGEAPSVGYTTLTATAYIINTGTDEVPVYETIYVDNWDTSSGEKNVVTYKLDTETGEYVVNTDSDGNTVYCYERYIDGQKTKQNIYDFVYAPEYEMYADDVKGTKEGELCYYVDNEAEKTRYMYLKNSRGFGAGPTLYEYQWMVETLESTPDDWHIVCVAHEWFQTRTSYPDEVDVSSQVENCQGVVKLLDAYNSREIGYSNYYSVPYDFSENKATVEFCIGGDNHRDNILYSEGGIPLIIIITDGQGRSKNNKPDVPATKNTTDENAVSAFIADWDSKTLNIVRTGAGQDMVIDLKAVGGTYVEPTSCTNLLDTEDFIKQGVYIGKSSETTETEYNSTDYFVLDGVENHGKTWKYRDDVTFRFKNLKATAADIKVVLYSRDDTTGDYTICTYFDLNWSTGCWLPEKPANYTYPAVYDVDENGYVTYIDITSPTCIKDSSADGYKVDAVRICAKNLDTDVIMTYNEFIPE